VPTPKQRARRAVSRIVEVPPRDLWPYTLPAAARLHELRWRTLLRRTPAVTGEEHAARTGVKKIEEVMGCPLCGERHMQPLLHPGEVQKGRWRYHVVRCPACGFLYRHPGIRPERLGDLYAGNYSKFLTGHYSDKRRRRYALVLDAFAPLFADGAGRRLLDYGCGAGHFLEVAHERGFDGYGVDLSADSVEEARRRPGGANAYFGTPLEVPQIAAGGFDVVCLWSVLAHLPRPLDDLAMLRGLMGPDGVLIVLTVNANSLRLKAHRDAWNGFTKNHVVFFSPSTLTRALREAGFGAVVMRPAYGDGLEAGTVRLSRGNERRLRRNVDHGNQGNMLRAVAFADRAGPARWGLEADAVTL
jgi:SAM-dependent methyltransferase